MEFFGNIFRNYLRRKENFACVRVFSLGSGWKTGDVGTVRTSTVSDQPIVLRVLWFVTRL
jgi:hypothetical protein